MPEMRTHLGRREALSYRVPSMAQIQQIPLTGLRAVSTFSGCGGSSLGLRMAGVKVVWASEFIPAAAEVYRLNHRGTTLDTRDIREVDASEILKATGGDIDILEGSPPCSAFSLAGIRDKGWGKEKFYSGTTQRVDDLFFEYTRLLRGLKPRVFIAENVVGLIIGKAKAYFAAIVRALRESGYSVEVRQLNSAYLGVPQARERLIFLGVREDLQKKPRFPRPRTAEIPLEQAIQGLESPGPFNVLKPGGILEDLYRSVVPGQTLDHAVIRRTRGKSGSCFGHYRLSWKKTVPTVLACGSTLYHPDEARTLGIAELKRVCSFPDDFQLTGSFCRQWERLGRSVPPLMMKAIAESISEVLL